VPTLDSFYVRLSGLNLFYTETEDDLIVLGTIALKNIQATADGMEASCFRVVDQENDNWDMCDPEGHSPHEWVCAISEQLGMPCDLEP